MKKDINEFLIYFKYLGWGSTAKEVLNRAYKADDNYVKTTACFEEAYAVDLMGSKLTAIFKNDFPADLMLQYYYIQVKLESVDSYSIEQAREDALCLMFAFYGETGYFAAITPEDPMSLLSVVKSDTPKSFLNHLFKFLERPFTKACLPAKIDTEKLCRFVALTTEKTNVLPVTCDTLLDNVKSNAFYPYLELIGNADCTVPRYLVLEYLLEGLLGTSKQVAFTGFILCSIKSRYGNNWTSKLVLYNYLLSEILGRADWKDYVMLSEKQLEGITPRVMSTLVYDMGGYFISKSDAEGIYTNSKQVVIDMNGQHYKPKTQSEYVKEIEQFLAGRDIEILDFLDNVRKAVPKVDKHLSTFELLKKYFELFKKNMES